MKELIGDFSSLKIKKFLRISINNFIKIYQVERAFNLSENEAVKLMKKLESLAYVTYLPNISAWTNTFQGDWIAHQTIPRKIKRKEAETIIKDISTRINIANTSKRYLWKVKLAFVYGDFINKDMNELRDLTIGLILDQKNKHTYKKMAFNKANESKKPLPHFVAVLFEPQYELLRFLKKQKHNVRLQIYQDPAFFKPEQIEFFFKG